MSVGVLTVEKDDASGGADQVYQDDTSKTLRVGNWVWNTGTLAWDRMTQPLTGTTTIESMLAKKYWLDTRYEYASSTVMYVGRSTTHKAATDTGDLWWVMKYTFDANGRCTRIEGPLNGNWDGRAALAWAA